ncbi:unnamed protein product [Discosporangium mesarthrocarpum]
MTTRKSMTRMTSALSRKQKWSQLCQQSRRGGQLWNNFLSLCLGILSSSWLRKHHSLWERSSRRRRAGRGVCMCIGTAPPSPPSAIRPAPYPWRTILGWHSLLTSPSPQSSAAPAGKRQYMQDTDWECKSRIVAGCKRLNKGNKIPGPSSSPWRLHRQMMLDGVGKGRTSGG